MEELFSQNPGISSLIFLFVSLLVGGLFAKNFVDMIKFGKKFKKYEEDKVKYIETKIKNDSLKKEIVENQAQRESEIQAAVELIPDEGKSETVSFDALSDEWNKKFGKKK